MVDDTSTDDLDEEIKQLEEELASLEEDEEEEPEKEKGSGLKDRVPFLGGSETEEEPQTEPDEANQAEEASAGDEDGGPVDRLLGRFRGSEQEEEAPDEEPSADADEDPADSLEGETAVETAPPEEETRREQDETEEAQAAAPAGALAQDPPGASEETEPRTGPPEENLTADEKRESPRWERTEDGWRRRESDEALEDDETPATAQERPEEPEQPPEEDPEPRSLLARFQGGSPEDEDPEGPPPEAPPEDEDDDRSPLILAAWVLLALLGIAILAAGAYWLLGETGEDVTANLESDALDEDGTLIAATGTPIAFDASGSNGPVDAYEWDFGDGETTTTQEPTATHTYDERGTYTVTITVSGDGSSDDATREVRVVDAPTADATILLDGDPVAEPGTVGNNPFLGDTVTLDGTASTADEDQQITTYEWDIAGDGTPDETGQEATTSFDEPGAWEITLTVTDDLGNTDSETVTVHVGDQHTFDETMPTPGLEDAEGQSQRHNTSATLARGAAPVQLEATLTYGGDGDVALQADLDLSVETPAGTVYEAEDDEGDGEETLTVTGGEIDSLGEWSWIVTRDAQGGLTGSASEVDYQLDVEIVY